MKRCGRCKLEKPVEEFRPVKLVSGSLSRRGTCKECEREPARIKRRLDNQQDYSLENGNRIFPTLHDARCAMIKKMMWLAWKDGCGDLNSNDVKTRPAQECLRLVNDGYEFFYDGRFQHWAQLIDIDAEMEPVWN